MENIIVKNKMGKLVLRRPIICKRCGEADWSPVMENGECLVDKLSESSGDPKTSHAESVGAGIYIKRATALDCFSFEKGDAIPEIAEDGNPNLVSIRDIKSVLRSIPAADAEPIRHGQWIWNSHYCKWVCSACGGMEGECESPRCKWCGAHMEKK